MNKLNYIQFPFLSDINIDNSYALDVLNDNVKALAEIEKLKKQVDFKSLNTFSFSEDGFLSLMLKLKGKILVSKGESQAIIDAANKYKELGFDLDFISLQNDGNIKYEEIKKCDFIFISPYIMDTFYKIDMKKVRELTNAKIISNITATPDFKDCDVAILDAYKLTGFSFSSILLHNNFLEEQSLWEIDMVAIIQIYKAILNFKPFENKKNIFLNLLVEEFKDDIYFFVDNDKTLPYTLHFGLKNIKARELIRTLSLSNILITNGEGCSLGLSKPSRIIQEMNYKEIESRWALSLSFFENIDEEEIRKIVKIISKKYRQIRTLNG